ncbi:MAG TPA: sigma-70 family RNA polymerase sigma factor, partial [Solirubrobacteraceae bacterium]|nr:sigma-70 family RNA polymerase sigma factor [Solirubrobacteraceae bacterium]
MPGTSTALVLRASPGEDAAFASLYAEHHAAVLRCCRGILRDPDEAADAAQNAMLKALRAMRASGPPDDPRAWLSAIARNEAISLLRRRRSDEPLPAGDGPSFPAAEDRALDREEVRQLVGDLSELPERQRGALLMREVSGLGYDAIAQRLATSQGNARQNVHAARDNLRQMSAGREMRCDLVRAAI